MTKEPFVPVLISLKETCQLLGVSRTAINQWRAVGSFPKAVQLGEKRIAFVRAEVMAWLQEKIDGR